MQRAAHDAIHSPMAAQLGFSLSLFLCVSSENFPCLLQVQVVSENLLADANDWCAYSLIVDCCSLLIGFQWLIPRENHNPW